MVQYNNVCVVREGGEGEGGGFELYSLLINLFCINILVVLDPSSLCPSLQKK